MLGGIDPWRDPLLCPSIYLWLIDGLIFLLFFSLIGFYGEKESDAQDPSSWRPFLHLQPITPRHRLQGPADIRPSLDLLPRPRRNFQLFSYIFLTEVSTFHHLHIRWKWKSTFKKLFHHFHNWRKWNFSTISTVF